MMLDRSAFSGSCFEPGVPPAPWGLLSARRLNRDSDALDCSRLSFSPRWNGHCLGATEAPCTHLGIRQQVMHSHVADLVSPLSHPMNCSKSGVDRHGDQNYVGQFGVQRQQRMGKGNIRAGDEVVDG